MTDDSSKEMERTIARIESSDMDPKDRELLNEFKVLLSHDGYSEYWHGMVLERMSLIARRRDAHGVALADLFESDEAVLDILNWLQGGEYYDAEKEKLFTWGEKSQSHYRSALRKFGRILNDGTLPEEMEIIYGGDNSKPSESAPKRWEILLWHEDVVPLLRACENDRDRALIAVAWDSGARPFEIRDLTYGDISPDGDFLKITVGGKNTPQRDPRLVIASPFLKKWLEGTHPANDEKEGFTPETAIWTKLNENQELASGTFEKIIPEQIESRIDIKKPTNLRQFRKSRSSVLASREEIGRGDLEERQGWETGSDIVDAYITRFGSGTDDKISKSDGLAESDLPDSDHEELPDPAPVKCPNCSRWTPGHRNKCLWCVTNFNTDASKEAEHRDVESPVKNQARRDLINLVTNGELTEENIETARQLAEVVRQYPEILDFGDSLQELMERHNVKEYGSGESDD